METSREEAIDDEIDNDDNDDNQEEKNKNKKKQSTTQIPMMMKVPGLVGLVRPQADQKGGMVFASFLSLQH